MNPRLTYFLGGVVASFGVVVTVTDPETLDNVMTFPERVSAYFEGDEPNVHDVTAMRIILKSRIRQMFDVTFVMSNNDKDQLAAHYANECMKAPGKSLLFDANLADSKDITDDTDTHLGNYSPGTISENISSSINSLPDFLSQCLFRVGIALADTGLINLKHHVENPTAQPLQNGAIRLRPGSLFTIPIVDEAIRGPEIGE